MLIVLSMKSESTFNQMRILVFVFAVLRLQLEQHSTYILIIKPTRCTNFSNLFLE